MPVAKLSILSLPFISRTGGEGEKNGKRVMGWDKDREITHKLLTQAKQTRLGEMYLIYHKLKVE